MNKHPAQTSAPLLPLWHVGDGVSLFAGALSRHAAHSHSVPVLLAGLYEAFEIGLDGVRVATRTAVVPAGVSYDLDARGAPIGVFYLEPHSGRTADLIGLLNGGTSVAGAMVGGLDITPQLRALYEAGNARAWAHEALDDVVSRTRAKPSLDPRLAQVLMALSHADAGCDGPRLSAHEAAMQAGLSVSRFQHLFTQEVGVPFRRYRSWQRLKLAIREVVRGESLAGAACLAGFADQAHFARAFRQAFGAPPSRTLAAVR